MKRLVGDEYIPVSGGFIHELVMLIENCVDNGGNMVRFRLPEIDSESVEVSIMFRAVKGEDNEDRS